MPREEDAIDILYRSALERPKVSLVLLDWNCRESFHIFQYLQQQDVPRDWFEVQWIEFYSRRPTEISDLIAAAEAKNVPPPVDLWLVLDVPETSYYHKHFMYNAGITLARGELVCIMDSDAMLKPGFVRSLITAFEKEQDIALHLDEVRNVDQRFHPFCSPSFEEVLGPGCINWDGKRTTGLGDHRNPLLTRNYGACMCAQRQDLIDVGGADEHNDYLGHVCGPYDLTFRLVNASKREIWHQDEFLYHVWHPGTDGGNNYIGPHDGRNNSTRALQARLEGQVLPWLENPAIRALRENPGRSFAEHELLGLLMDQARLETWVIDQDSLDLSLCRQAYYGSRFEEAVARYEALSNRPEDPGFLAEMGRAHSITGRRDHARVLLERALREAPGLRLAHSALGWLESNQGNHAEAMGHFDQALSSRDCLTDDFLLEALRGRGWAAFNLGRFDQAERDFREGASHAPGNWGALADIQFGLGLALFKQESYREAGRVLAQALEHAVCGERGDLAPVLEQHLAMTQAMTAQEPGLAGLELVKALCKTICRRIAAFWAQQ